MKEINQNLKQKRNFTLYPLFFEFFVVTLFSIFYLLFSVSSANAAILYFLPSSGSYDIGDILSVSVYVSSTDQAANAASGVISFPQDELEVTSLSKSGSIFALWVQEPSFSNTLGSINFEGIMLNPGFIGAAGKIITANFKVNAAGVANLNFSSGSVLANDGKGTNILTGLGKAQLKLGHTDLTAPESTTPSTVFGTPPAPQISSSTHPDPNKWYAKKDAKFTWPTPSDVTGVRLLVSKVPAAIPAVTYASAISEKGVTNLDEGIWYFHVQFRNANGWGGVSRFRFQIDTEPPESFEIKFTDGKETTNPRPTILCDTADSLSGIEYYKVKIGEGDFFTLSSENAQGNLYTLPLQYPGTKTILVQATDKAGNYTTAVEEFVTLPIEAAVIIDPLQTVRIGEALTVKGASRYPNAMVTVFVRKEGEKEARARSVKTDNEGNWFFVYDKSLEKGVYQVWAEVIDERGAKSNPTEAITIMATLPPLIEFGKIAIDYLTVVAALITLIIVLALVALYKWRQILLWRKKTREEAKEVEESVARSFKALQREVEGQIEFLDEKPGLARREKEVRDKLQEALNASREFISKEIKNIEKEL